MNIKKNRTIGIRTDDHFLKLLEINLYEWIWDASIKCIGILSKSLNRKSDEVSRI